MRFLLALSLCVVCAWADDHLLRKLRDRLDSSSSLLADRHVEERWFDQLVDHQSRHTFRQRYVVNDEFDRGGPVFLYVSGEAQLNSSRVLSGQICELANATGGLVIALEHRFYGKSQPMPDLSTQSLRLLTVDLALADAAWFVTKIPAILKIDNQRKWVAVGGSYAGALSAWLRLKYPHLFAASFASSAPVFAKADFYEYDQAVQKALGRECSAAVKGVLDKVSSRVQQEHKVPLYKALFGAENIEDDVAFLYLLADIVSYVAQYDLPGKSLLSKLCQHDFVAEPDMGHLVTFVKYFYKTIGTNATDMDMLNIKDITNKDPSRSSRQWMYQSCTTFGFFQIAPKVGMSLRSSLIDEKWHNERVCRDIFGLDPPFVQSINSMYGGVAIANSSSKTFFFNGGSDPWRILSVQSHALTKGAHNAFGYVPKVGHCADLAAGSEADPAPLTAIRSEELNRLAEWL